MNARSIDRSMIIRSHPAADALEARIQSNVTVAPSWSGRWFIAEANCTSAQGVGPTIEDAIENLISAMGLAV